MGYTNYWTPTNRNPKPEVLTKEFRDDIHRIVDVANSEGVNDNLIQCAIDEGNDYIVVCPAKDGSESFYLETGDAYPNERKCGFNIFCFCKTFATPFDAVVKCCIAAGIKHRLFEPEMSFDGDVTDIEYLHAIQLARACGNGLEEILNSFKGA